MLISLYAALFLLQIGYKRLQLNPHDHNKTIPIMLSFQLK